MPSVWELTLTLMALFGLSQLIAEKGERAWAGAIAVVLWVFLEFILLVLGVWAEWAGWFVR